MAREPRFPGIDWYCDNCGTLLNTQENFDDHRYTWKCRKCGYKNSISWDNISPGDSMETKCLLYFLGFLSFVGFWTSIMLGASLIGFRADASVYLIPLIIFVAIYVIAFAMSLFVEFGIRHTKLTARNIAFVIFRNLKEDILTPLMALKEVISNALAFITRVIPIKKKYVWHSNVKIVLFAVAYIVLFVLEIIAFNRINQITAADWWNFIQSGCLRIYGLVAGK